MTNAEASKGVCIGGQEFVVDAILCAERALLEIRGVKEAARRFNDLGERREEKSAGPADRLQGRALQPFMRAYYMLRHLKCREQRCRLFGSLQFFSECATKAGTTQATRQWTRSSWRFTTQCSECHLPDFMSELSSFDFESEMPATSSLYQSIHHQHCQARGH